MSTEEEMFSKIKLDLSTIQLEGKFAAIGIDTFAESWEAEGSDITLDIIDEVDLVGVEVPVLGLKLGVIKADVRGGDDKMDNISLVIGVNVVSFGNLYEMRLEVSLSRKERSAERCTDGIVIV